MMARPARVRLPLVGAALCAGLGFPASAAAQQAPAPDAADLGWFERDRLTGDWGGVRSSLSDAGFVFEAFGTFDFLGNVTGGTERGTAVLGTVDLTLDADLEHALGWTGGSAFLYGLGNFGRDPSELVGDVQGVDNIAAPEDYRLYEAWLEQQLWDDDVSLLVGLYDVNSEFDIVQAGSLFVHSSFGLGADFGLSGRNGPSTFPVTSLGARLRVRPTEQLYVQAVVSDGVPDMPLGGEPFRVSLNGDDGALWAAEFGFYDFPTEQERGRMRRISQASDVTAAVDDHHFSKAGVGVWGYTGEFDVLDRVDAAGNPVTRDGTWGAYTFGEHQFFRESEDPFQGLTAFARVGFAQDDVNVVDGYVGFGLVYRGLFTNRREDRTGLAVAAARFGDPARRAARQAGVDADAWEIAIELTHRAVLSPAISLQPELQYVINPGGDGGLADAVVVGARLILAF